MQYVYRELVNAGDDADPSESGKSRGAAAAAAAATCSQVKPEAPPLSNFGDGGGRKRRIRSAEAGYPCAIPVSSFLVRIVSPIHVTLGDRRNKKKNIILINHTRIFVSPSSIREWYRFIPSLKR